MPATPEKEARMETLLGGALFALFLAAQILAVIAVSREPTADRSRQPMDPDEQRARLIWQSGT
jgi:hypothetical protein